MCHLCFFPMFILCHPSPESLKWISRTISALWLYFPWAAVWSMDSLKWHCISVCFYNCVCGCFPKCNDFLLYNGYASSQSVMVPRGRWVGRIRLNVNAQLSANASNNVGNQSKNWQVRCRQIKNLCKQKNYDERAYWMAENLFPCTSGRELISRTFY